MTEEELERVKTMTDEKRLEYITERINKLYKRHLNTLPDGFHKHADGELYIHETWYDPRTGVSFKSIHKYNDNL